MNTDKKASIKDYEQTLRSSYNDANATLGVDGFVVGKVGRRITRAVATTNVTDDTEIYNFYDNQTDLLYTLQIIYTDGSRSDILEVERTA